MEVRLSPKVKREVSVTMRDYGYESVKEFIEDALHHRILALKKAEFAAKTGEIRKIMSEKGIAEKEILKDFEAFSHGK